MSNGHSWSNDLTADQITLFDKALAALKARGLAFPHVGRDAFPARAMAPELARWAAELENGRGFLLLRGLPVHRYNEADIRSLYCGIGLHLGVQAEDATGADLPQFVKGEFGAFLECGILARGCLRLRCDDGGDGGDCVQGMITRHLLGQAGLKPGEADNGAVMRIHRS